MKSFPRRLLLLFAGITGCAACASALTIVVEYKPWGVPDARRQEYDETIAAWDRRDALRERFENAARPIVATGPVRHSAGLQDPKTTSDHQFEIRNEGTQPLKLEVRFTSSDCEAALGNAGLDKTGLDRAVVASGEATRLNVSWTNADEPGDFEHTVVVRTSDPLQEELEFLVSGTIKADLAVPASVVFPESDPAHRTDLNFLVYSQTWDEFEIVDAKSDLEIFDWHAAPADLSDADVDGLHATCVWRVRLWTTAMEYGRYSGNVTLSVRRGDSPAVVRSVAVKGRVRPPIIFHSPQLHMADGLDLGTLFAGEEHQFHVLVRLRGDIARKIEVLDIRPAELKATLTPQSQPGNYRLTLTIPKDCPMTIFNVPEKHGYVEVGDPGDEHFSSWFPVKGAVVPRPVGQ